MTIIAYRNKILACDSKVSSGSAHWAAMKKIKKIKGWLIGAAGDLDAVSMFLQKFNPETIKDNKHPLVGLPNTLEAIIVDPTGVIYYMENSGMLSAITTDGFIAIGSGCEAAMGAMAAGATAREAVKIAIKYGEDCGGKAHYIRLGKA